ncbi:MAG: DUF1217 domain-containing protein [Rubrimonas sp.]
MSFKVFFPTGGIGGFDYLTRTRDLQTRQMAEQDAEVRIDVIYLRTAMMRAGTANALLTDERLAGIVLKAFGLQDRAEDTTTLRRALNESTEKPRALTPLHEDVRVRELARLLGYGDEGGPRNRDAAVIAEIERRFLAATFEDKVAKQDRKLAEALKFDRLLSNAASAEGSNADKWEWLVDDPAAVRLLNRSMDLSDNFAALPERQRIAQLEATYGKAFYGTANNLNSAANRRNLVSELLAYDPSKAFAAEEGGTIGFYQPILPFEGLAGWSFLNRTKDRQVAMFNRTAEMRRDVAYFMQNIGKADTAEKLVNDKRLLKVVMGAFGLGDEVDKKALMLKIIAGGTEDRLSPANKMADPRFKEMTAMLGYGDSKGAQVDEDGFARRIVEMYRAQAFEIAVGDVDPNMRLAMNFDRMMQSLTRQDLSDKAFAFRILGDKALRDVVEGALGLPKEFAKLELDRQAEVLNFRVRKMLGQGGFKEFGTQEGRDKFLRGFFIRAHLEGGPSMLTPGVGALTILQGAGGGGLLG